MGGAIDTATGHHIYTDMFRSYSPASSRKASASEFRRNAFPSGQQLADAADATLYVAVVLSWRRLCFSRAGATSLAGFGGWGVQD